MTRWIALLTLIVVAVLAATAAAQPAGTPGGPGAGPGFGPGPGFIAQARRALNLSEDQARRLEQAFAGFRTRTARTRINMQRARLDLREAFLAQSPDRAQVETISRRIGSLSGELAQARVTFLLEVRTILTLEQFQRLQMLMLRAAARARRH